MSYILEALKKAAEQRAQQTPALRRLVSAPSVRSSPSALPRAAALAVGAIAVAALLAVALRPASRPAPPLADAVPTPASVPAIELAPSERPRGEPPARPVASVRIAPPPGRVTPLVPEGRTAAPAPARPAAAPAPAVTEPGLPLPPRPAGAPESVAGLKLEVLVYSDVPAERMVFINGRKYSEGDTVPEGGRIEEIKQDGVVLNDQGRRFTLRQ